MNPNLSKFQIAQRVAEEWDAPVEQIIALGKIIEERGGLMNDDYEDLEQAAIAYSIACSVRECTGWLPFNVMPNWEDDVFCILEDEDAWRATVDANESVRALASKFRKALSAQIAQNA